MALRTTHPTADSGTATPSSSSSPPPVPTASADAPVHLVLDLAPVVSAEATSPPSQPTDPASSPRHPEAPHRVVTPPRRPVHYARPTQQWLDFLAGLLAQTARAERASADRTESPARP